RTVRQDAVSATAAMIIKDKDALAWRGWFDQPKPALHAVEALVHAVKALVERHHWLDQYLKGPFEDPYARLRPRSAPSRGRASDRDCGGGAVQCCRGCCQRLPLRFPLPLRRAGRFAPDARSGFCTSPWDAVARARSRCASIAPPVRHRASGRGGSRLGNANGTSGTQRDLRRSQRIPLVSLGVLLRGLLSDALARRSRGLPL